MKKYKVYLPDDTIVCFKPEHARRIASLYRFVYKRDINITVESLHQEPQHFETIHLED